MPRIEAPRSATTADLLTRRARWSLLLLEVLGVASFVAGVALVYVPAAFMVAGVLAALGAERALAGRDGS